MNGNIRSERYVPIKAFEFGDYILGFPNEEVRLGFLNGLAPYYLYKRNYDNNSMLRCLVGALRRRDVDSAMTELRSIYYYNDCLLRHSRILNAAH